MNIQSSDVVSAVAVIIAGVTATLSYRKDRREQLNQKIQAAKWQREYFADLLKWSDESILLLSEALHLCDLDPKKCENGKFFDSRHTLRIRFSAQIDKGRWFFQNYIVDQHGQEKEGAYQGYRHEVLDGLVFAYRAVTKLDYVDYSKNSSAREDISLAKRQFTTEIQKVLAPGSRDAEFKQLTKLVAQA